MIGTFRPAARLSEKKVGGVGRHERLVTFVLFLSKIQHKNFVRLLEVNCHPLRVFFG